MHAILYSVVWPERDLLALKDYPVDFNHCGIYAFIFVMLCVLSSRQHAQQFVSHHHVSAVDARVRVTLQVSASQSQA